MKFKTLVILVAAVVLIGSLFFVQADDKKVGINLQPLLGLNSLEQ
jgi:hypothetical protein